MNPDVVALFVPIASVFVIGLVIVAFLYFRNRNRLALQQTIQLAIEKGTELTPEVIDRLAGPKPAGHGDLRKSAVWTAVGVACMLFGLLLGEEDAIRPLAAIGMFPLLIGVAYFVMWKLAKPMGVD